MIGGPPTGSTPRSVGAKDWALHPAKGFRSHHTKVAPKFLEISLVVNRISVAAKAVAVLSTPNDGCPGTELPPTKLVFMTDELRFSCLTVFG